ncbi:MAG: hypothetical protein LBB55_07585 [Zoogloeaceae bacterium]|jgi:hypothetical protein|nr:hypothetical protein [Zoogloeaceae bacterium]
MSETSPVPRENADDKPVGAWATVGAFAFGAYLMVGGCDALFNGKWPIYMLPQLDFVAFVFGWSGILAAYVAGTCSLLFGLWIIGVFFTLWRERRTGQLPPTLNSGDSRR